MTWSVALLIATAVTVGPAVAKDIKQWGFVGPYDHIWGDDECSHVGNNPGKTLSECKELCKLTKDCTAFNYREDPADCVLRACGLPAPQPQTNYPPYYGYAIAAAPKCSSVGGRCIPRRVVQKKCNGKNDETFECADERKVCCIEGCPVNAGFFWMASTSQCFKLMTDHGNLTWDEGKSVCQRNWLMLAHPYDAVGLRSYLSQKYGEFQAWLNARGDGNAIRWVDNGASIPLNSPLWSEGAPYEGEVGSNKCLKTYAWSTDEDQDIKRPFWSPRCEWRNPNRYPLCELDIHMLE